jgi:ferredoxin
MGFPKSDVKVATIRCEPSGREVRVVHDSNLMDAILQTGLGLGQSCDGIALCGFCRVRVLDGIENLTPPRQRNARCWPPSTSVTMSVLPVAPASTVR